MSHLDGIIINAVTAYNTRRKINFLAAEDVYNKNFLFRFLCDLGNTIPVQRSTSDRVALLKVIKLLKSDKLVGLFPEIKFPDKSNLEISFGSRFPIEEPVGVISHPSARRTDMLPELPIVSPLSNRDFASVHIESSLEFSVI